MKPGGTRTKVKALIFDFDGTIADTFDLAVAIFRQMGYNRVPTDDKTIERLRGMSAKQVVQFLGIPWWRLPWLVYKARRILNDHIDEVKAIDGIPEVLAQLHQKGFQMYIVSSNSDANIKRFLRQNNLASFFEHAYGGGGVFSKAKMISEVMWREKLSLDHCCYIGDEVRDAEAARKSGIRHVAVSWGYNSHQALEKAQAEKIIDKPAQLLSIFPA